MLGSGAGGAANSNNTAPVYLAHTDPVPIDVPTITFTSGVASTGITYVQIPLIIPSVQLAPGVTINPVALPPIFIIPPLGPTTPTPPPPPPLYVTQPPPVPTGAPPPPPPPNTYTMRTGTNLTLMESVTFDQYSQNSGPPTTKYPQYSTALLDWMASSGVASVRFTFSWEAMQSNLGGTIPSAIGGLYSTYYLAYVNVINALLARDINVIVEPWQFNPNTNDTDITYRGAAFTPANFQDFWGKMALAINSATSNSQKVSFGLINEPHNSNGDVGVTLTNWYADAQAAINGIRSTGAINTIWVPGMNWADCGSFVSNGSAAQHLLLSDPANNFGVSVHNYNGQLTTDGNASSSAALTNAMTSLIAWSRAHGNIKISVGEMAIDDGNPNGTNGVAVSQWAAWNTYCQSNKDIITGWHWWATAPSNLWDTSDSSSGFHWNLTSGSTASSGSSTSPSNPISNGSYPRDNSFTLNDGAQTDYIYVPSNYNGAHTVPTKLFIFLHGNGGDSSGDIWTVSPGGSQDWISIAPGGRENSQGHSSGWNENMPGGLIIVTNAVAYMKTRFNISQVFLGGYSGGGDLAYYTIFNHSSTYAGIISENTNPWRDNPFSNSSSAAFSANSSGYKFHCAHLLHTSDTTYPRAETLTAFNTMTANGYPVILAEKAGTHSDANTDPDLIGFFPQYLEAGWTSPATAASGGVQDSTYMTLIKSSLGRF